MSETSEENVHTGRGLHAWTFSFEQQDRVLLVCKIKEFITANCGSLY